MWRCNDELRVRADELDRSSKKDAKHYIGNSSISMVGVCFSLYALSISCIIFGNIWWYNMYFHVFSLSNTMLDIVNAD